MWIANVCYRAPHNDKYGPSQGFLLSDLSEIADATRSSLVLVSPRDESPSSPDKGQVGPAILSCLGELRPMRDSIVELKCEFFCLGV